MPLPRNVTARNKNYRTKVAPSKAKENNINILNKICLDNHVGDLSFRDCRYATADGKMTLLDYDDIRANMRSGVFVVKTKNITEVTDQVYDVVKLENDKREKDLKKKEMQMEKARVEMERLAKQNAKTTIDPEASQMHQDLLNEMIENTKEHFVEEITKTVVEEPTETVAEEITETPLEDAIEPVVEDTVETPLEDTADTKKKQTKNQVRNREKIVKKFKKQLNQKIPVDGNKYFRKFMKSCREKLFLEYYPDIKYFEVKSSATCMVIDEAKVYKIDIPNDMGQTFFLITGNLQMKTDLMRRIDPTYRTDSSMREQENFIERIQAKENTNMAILREDIEEEDIEEDIDADMHHINNENIINDDIVTL